MTGLGSSTSLCLHFTILHQHQPNLGFQSHATFFGSEHGKRESGESGLVKSKVAEYALRPNSNVQNASDIKRFGDEHLTKNSISKLKKRADEVIAERSFHVVNQIYRPAQRDELETIKRSMKFHAIASCNQKGCIMSRNLACFCNACVKDEKEKCVNSKYVQDWEKQKSILFYDWVKVVYEEEIFLGKIETILPNEIDKFRVRCLSLPFGIREYQDFEPEYKTVCYPKVYSNDNNVPKLEKIGRKWQYLY